MIRSQPTEEFIVSTEELEIGFSREDGGLRVLRRRGGPNLAGHGAARPSVDVFLADRGWLAERVFVRYLSHTVEERPGVVEVTIAIGIGPLIVTDRYRLCGAALERRATVRNVGEDDVQLMGVRLWLPWLTPGGSGGRFDAPGNSVRPRVPFQTAAELRPGVLPRRFFAPGLREGRAIERTPTSAPGLLAIHDTAGADTLLCWFESEEETALPELFGNGQALTIGHHVELSGRLKAEASLAAGVQRVVLLQEPWPQALESYRTAARLTPIAVADAAWLRDASIYEVHPAQHGGFQGLTAELPRLAALGFNTICLLPIWERGARPGRPWDDPEHAGGPYAIADFERLDATLGTPGELHALVRAAHHHAIRVLLDLPLSGCAPGSPMVSAHRAWLAYDELGVLAQSPGPDRLVCYDWSSATLHNYFVDLALTMLHEYELDGFRVTPPRTPQPNWAHGLPHHASAGSLGFLRLIDRLREEVRAARPDAALLAALGGGALAQRCDAAVDELPHHMFFHFGLGRLTPTELGAWLADHQAQLPGGALRVCYTESHQTRHLNPLADGMRGSRISRLLLAGLVIAGFVPQIWAGQEQEDAEFIERLLAARAASPALRSGETRHGAITSDSSHVFATLRAHPDETVIGLLNVAPHRQAVTLRVRADGLALPAGPFYLASLLPDTCWIEGGRDRWSAGDLASLRLTLDPYSAYCLALRPTAPQAHAPEEFIAEGVAG